MAGKDECSARLMKLQRWAARPASARISNELSRYMPVSRWRQASVKRDPDQPATASGGRSRPPTRASDAAVTKVHALHAWACASRRLRSRSHLSSNELC